MSNPQIRTKLRVFSKKHNVTISKAPWLPPAWMTLEKSWSKFKQPICFAYTNLYQRTSSFVLEEVWLLKIIFASRLLGYLIVSIGDRSISAQVWCPTCPAERDSSHSLVGQLKAFGYTTKFGSWIYMEVDTIRKRNVYLADNTLARFVLVPTCQDFTLAYLVDRLGAT